jgi:hypothetical protein
MLKLEGKNADGVAGKNCNLNEMISFCAGVSLNLPVLYDFLSKKHAGFNADMTVSKKNIITFERVI